MPLCFCFGMWRRCSWFSLKGRAGIQGSVNGQASDVGLDCNATHPIPAPSWASGHRGGGMSPPSPRSGLCRPAVRSMGGGSMTRFVGLDASQKLTAVCVVDETGRRLWRGQCATDPGRIERMVRGHAGEEARIGVETGPMTPWLVHELRARGLDVACLDARHAGAALKMQMKDRPERRGGPGADHAHGVASSGAREVARCGVTIKVRKRSARVRKRSAVCGAGRAKPDRRRKRQKIWPGVPRGGGWSGDRDRLGRGWGLPRGSTHGPAAMSPITR